MRKLLATAVLAVLLSGCGGTANVTGKVKYQGKPVVFGSVVIIGSDGLPKAGTIQPDGSYRVAGVPVGPVKIAVSSPPPPGAAVAAPKGVRGEKDEEDRGRPAEAPASPEVIKGWFPLAAKFGDPATSQLTADVRSGSPVDLDLK